MICEKCGATVAEGSQFCGKCGQTVNATACDNVQVKKYNTICVVGFTVAMVSLLLNFFGIVGIAAVVLSVVGLQQVQARQEKGKWMAITGIAVGGFSIFWAVIMLFAMI